MANQEQRREQLSVPVDADLRAALKRAAEREHRTVASYVRHALAQMLEEQRGESAAA
jgi:hypothetical protein